MTDDGHSTSRYEPVPLALWMIAIVTIAPFPILATAYGWGAPDIALPALGAILTWTAVVLAFLGGVRWGLESGRPTPRLYRLLISIASPIAAECLKPWPEHGEATTTLSWPGRASTMKRVSSVQV